MLVFHNWFVQLHYRINNDLDMLENLLNCFSWLLSPNIAIIFTSYLSLDLYVTRKKKHFFFRVFNPFTFWCGFYNLAIGDNHKELWGHCPYACSREGCSS